MQEVDPERQRDVASPIAAATAVAIAIGVRRPRSLNPSVDPNSRRPGQTLKPTQ